MLTPALHRAPAEHLGISAGTGTVRSTHSGAVGALLRRLVRLPAEPVAAAELRIVNLGDGRQMWQRRFGRGRPWSSELHWADLANLHERVGPITLVFCMHCRTDQRHLELRRLTCGPLRIGRCWMSVDATISTVANNTTTTITVAALGGRLGTLTYTAQLATGTQS